MHLLIIAVTVFAGASVGYYFANKKEKKQLKPPTKTPKNPNTLTYAEMVKKINPKGRQALHTKLDYTKDAVTLELIKNEAIKIASMIGDGEWVMWFDKYATIYYYEINKRDWVGNLRPRIFHTIVTDVPNTHLAGKDVTII